MGSIPDKKIGIPRQETLYDVFITVLIGDDFPELCSDLVSALAGLEVDDFSHCDWWVEAGNK